MQIEIWAEITCPWCGLGSHRADRAVAQFSSTERRYRSRVRDDARRAQRLGATGAPFIVVDGRYGIPGAADSDTLRGQPQTAWDETHPITLTGDAPACGPDARAAPLHL